MLSLPCDPSQHTIFVRDGLFLLSTSYRMMRTVPAGGRGIQRVNVPSRLSVLTMSASIPVEDLNVSPAPMLAFTVAPLPRSLS